jgi:hypothetical protein
MTETSFPLTDSDFTNAQWAAIVGDAADGILDDWGNPYSITVNTNDTVTIGVSSTGTNRAVVNGFGHSMDAPVTLPVPAVTSATRYHVGLLYDPANGALPVSLQVLKGTNPPLTSEQQFLPLFTFDRTVGQTLQAATLTTLRPRRRQTISVASASALDRMWPLLFLYGTEVYSESEDLWFRTAGNAAAPRWDQIGAPTALAGYTNDGATVKASSSTPTLVAGKQFSATGKQTVLVTVTATVRVLTGTLGAGNMFIALNDSDILNPTSVRLARVQSSSPVFVSLTAVGQAKGGSNSAYFRVNADSTGEDLAFTGISLGITAIG